jgi:predicted GNAT family N-acyltransferase
LAKEKQIERLLIHAELTAAGFYEGLGYCSVGKPYDEDGVPCITLEKQL